MSDVKPKLARQSVKTLKQYCVESFEEDLYDAGLECLVGGYSYEWLEAALLGGYVPHLEAAGLAIRGHHLWLQEILADDQLLAGDRIGWLQSADGYREIIGMLEEFVAETEHALAQLERRLAPKRPEPIGQMSLEDADAADRRAEAALRRASEVHAHNQDAAVRRERYANPHAE